MTSFYDYFYAGAAQQLSGSPQLPPYFYVLKILVITNCLFVQRPLTAFKLNINLPKIYNCRYNLRSLKNLVTTLHQTLSAYCSIAVSACVSSTLTRQSVCSLAEWRNGAVQVSAVFVQVMF
ncbi:hypothetical protein AMECASPLE_019148 [Ameca splendens]|uniref:Uncharacterized protein n=1 Tax=Ameca splendens TaxID=208324 RepID=A0ABV0XFZ0_9TELE